MARTRLKNRQFQYSSSGNTLRTERLQEKTRTTKEELGRCHQTRPQIDGLNLGRSRGTGERQSRIASTCRPMQPSGCGRLLCYRRAFLHQGASNKGGVGNKLFSSKMRKYLQNGRSYVQSYLLLMTNQKLVAYTFSIGTKIDDLG